MKKKIIVVIASMMILLVLSLTFFLIDNERINNMVLLFKHYNPTSIDYRDY